MKLRPYQEEALEHVENEFKHYRSTLVVLPTGCHAKGTRVIMADGTTKAVEDIRVGDRLCSPSYCSRAFTPKTVLALHHGFDEMYRVTPTKGEPFVVNSKHVLALMRSGCEPGKWPVRYVTVEDYLTRSATFKHEHKLFRSDTVCFGNRPELPIDPYILGLFLGDGCLTHGISICLADRDFELVDAIERWAARNGYTLRAEKDSGASHTYHVLTGEVGCKGSELRQAFESLGLMGKEAGEKAIPQAYLTAGIWARVCLLAGLIDTDGYRADNGVYDYVSKSRVLADGVAFLARSVGLAAYVKPCRKTCGNTGKSGDYFRVNISGDCLFLPVRVRRKQSLSREQKKSVLRTGFTVEHIGRGEYFGFTVDGDNLYMTDDFTVMHNCGKTMLFADMIRRAQPGRAMVVAHREELITQAQDKIEKVTGLHAGIEMADRHATSFFGDAPPVVVSSIQTQCSGGDGMGRMANFDPMEFSLLVIDEAHHATSPTYRRVIDWYCKNPDLKVLGVTATPDRADEAALGAVFESVAYNYEISDAVKAGWLVPITQQMVAVETLDFSTVRTTAGDLNGADLAAILEEEENLQRIAAPTAEIIGQKRAVAFCASVREAERLAEILVRYGKPSIAISGTTDKEVRRRALADFADGKIQVVCNCGVLTEGFDDSGVEVIVMARPTKSRALYAQMVGRGTRPHFSIAGKLGDIPTDQERAAAIAASPKPGCLVIDFVGNAGKHKLMTTADILGGKYPEEVVEMAGARAKASKKPVDMTELLEQAAAEKAERDRAAAAARLALKGTAKYRLSGVDPFDVYGITPAPEIHGWDRRRHLTDNQVAALAKAIRKTPEQILDMPYPQQKQLFDQVAFGWKNNLASFAQMQILIRHGLAVPGMPIKFDAASAMIDRLAKRQGWGRR